MKIPKLLQFLVLIYWISLCNAGYGAEPEFTGQETQSDVQAPSHVPPYLRNQQFSKTSYSRSYSGTKTGYGGTKTGYVGTKTGYGGTKTGYGGTKTGYGGTKTGYGGTKTSYGGTKTSYSGTKTGYGGGGGYSEKRTWYSNSGSVPSFGEFQGSANKPYQALCQPECKNDGICVDTNTCVCAANFHGKFCEFEKKPCLVYPPLPMNSQRKCSNEMCTITCADGHKFPDGSSVTNMRCQDGQWQPTRADFSSIPDCAPECSPPCLNGGVCLSVNMCQCPQDYRGPQCQYSSNACDMRKLAFNGAYSCFGDADKFSCKLSCPSGSTYSSPPADSYTCLYSTGAFEPQPIPHCVFDEVVVITPSNYRHNKSYYEFESNQSIEDTEFSKTHYIINEGSMSNQHGLNQHGGNQYGGNQYGGNQYGENQEGMTQHSMNQHGVIVVQDVTPKGGSCFTWAGVHYKTFDGKIYSFESQCQHILVRDAKDHKYTVAIKQGVCVKKSYCPSELTIYLEDKPYILSVGEDGSVVFRNSRRLIPIPAMLPGIRVSMPGQYVTVQLDGQGVNLRWDTNNLVWVEGTAQVWNKTEGLCGTLDGNSENDFTTKDGIKAKTKAVMASSWQLNKIGDVCESTPPESSACASKSSEDMRRATQFCQKIFTKEKFRKCSKVMDVSLLLEACQWDYCACIATQSPEECACSTVAVYAKECLRHGVNEMKTWRDDDTCPMSCPAGMLYQPCGPDSQPSCSFPSPPGDNSSCSEGCFCPPGLLLEAGKCIQKTNCPCRLRNKSFPPAAVLKKDCNTCTCESGSWTCTQVPCGARCSAVGDPHYTTFDGLRYDFMGHCTYTMLQSENVTVDVENVACSGAITEAMNLTPYKGEGKPSCTKAVTLQYNGASIHLRQGGLILVNGKEVTTLPVSVGDIRIRAASSMFVIVQMPNKVDLWWDGSTRVFVDVPPIFHGKTKGLCGTFNSEQQDDFLTPEGDVEQAAGAFANKWKTRELCQDTDVAEPQHPCQANVENKEAAEKYCGKLKSQLFEPCHWHVDVERYYKDCVYDMCACAGDVSKCLCPILGDYAMNCAKNGVMIQWRYNVKECEVSCPGGQEYTVCADSCVRTCSDAAAAVTCRPRCVEGCACAPGQVLDKNNVCVPVGQCPCFHKGLEFDAGYKEVRPGRRERELCTCIGARWACVPASPADIQNYPPAEDIRSNCSAAEHMEFTTCMMNAPLTCKNMHLPPAPPGSECRPGCQCRAGYVLDAGTNKCVSPQQCPCHHGGHSYPDGHTMMEDCNTCECKSGNWSCTNKTCAGVCTSWGDSHVTTFDGTQYDFEGVCTYLLAKGTMDEKNGFSVEFQNVPCGTTGATCSKSLTLKIGTGNDEEIVSLTKHLPIPDTSKLKRIKQRIAGAFVFLDVPSLGISVQWDRGMRAYVRVDSVWRGRIKGLCGNYNGDGRDDFQSPSSGGLAESSPLIFADSWKLSPVCPKPMEAQDHCKQRPERKEWAVTTCGLMKRYPFTLCHSEIPATPYIERCEKDACACDSGEDCACACAALATYAHACTARGVSFKWRTKELCPMQCDEECSNYDSCVTPCPLETCDNTLFYNELKAMCEQETCVEGCKPKKSCPEGSVYTNATMTECVTRNKCRPVCMTLQDGRQVLEGEVIEEDGCHTCRCSKKQKICTGQPCATEPEGKGREYFTSPKPLDEPLHCVVGWTSWLNRGVPETQANGDSVDDEPLPLARELQIGSPMCSSDKMSKIECRTVTGHKTPKETGLNVECSLERGLVCREKERDCDDFEIRVYCDCGEEPFQCLNSTVPNHPHPDCTKFYECTPTVGASDEPHAVVKTCAPGLMYNPSTMVCDWPNAVVEIRPECGKPRIEEETTLATTKVYQETEAAPTKTTTPKPKTTTISTTPSPCPPGKVYAKCAYECDKLCDHFKKTLIANGYCMPGQKCAELCIEESIAKTKCEYGSLWRDRRTCVPVKDCTCDYNGEAVKPKEVVSEGCRKCQCLDNELHCDATDCVTINVPFEGSTHLPLLQPERFYTTSTFYINTTEVPTTTTKISTTQKTTVTTVATKATPPTTEVPTYATKATPTATASTSTQAPTTVKSPLILPSTVSPPPECTSDRYKDLLWGGDEPIPESSFTASSVANALFEPQYAVFNGHPMDITAGSWNPKVQDQHQYIQVELPQREPIYGVKMQGSPLFDQYVTSYEVMYGDDGQAFSKVLGPDGQPRIFRGPVDHNNAMTQLFEPPFEAKFIRLRPLTWHEEIAVRWELIGCGPPTTEPAPTTRTTPVPIQCDEPLGLNAQLPVENIEVSSNNDLRQDLKLDAEKGWRPIYSTPGEWVMFDFTSPRNITGIKTKGGPLGFVTKYTILYTSDLSVFSTLADMPANFDKETEVFNEFRPPIRARYLKVVPLKWKDAINMRIEPIGCFEPYPTTQPPPPAAAPSSPPPCAPCPGLVTYTECACAPPTKYYDGESCVSRDQCPCVEGFMTYAVGSAFRGDKCDECVCKLGGVTICKPAKECVCAPELVPKLTSSCECLCEPCGNGTRICPTSKLCLPLDKWCDGIVDCPDDETSCTTTTVTTERTTVEVTVEPTVVTTVGPTIAVTQVTTPPPQAQECPPVRCPPGYMVRRRAPPPRAYTSDLPPPRPRYSYRRYQKGGYAKGGYSKGGYSKGGFSKGGFGQQSESFSLAKPTSSAPLAKSPEEPCVQFQCVPSLPPLRPGSHPAALCSVPTCPPGYTLKLEPAGKGCPQYNCVPPPERRVYCELTGRTFNTFDGTEYKYDVCFHILARDSQKDGWIVLVRKKCRIEGCFNELIVKQDDQLILIKPNLMIEYDNYEYTVEQTTKICFQKNSFDVARLGNGVSVKSRKYNFTVMYNKDGDVKVGVLKSLQGTVDGLCGYFDGNPENDRRLPNGKAGSSIDQFGRAWAKPGLPANACTTKVINAEKQKRAWEMCDVVTKEPLSQCAGVLNLDKWRSICLEKICECTEQVVNGTKRTEEECRCLLVEQMVAECLTVKKNLDLSEWRIKLDCPAWCPAPLLHFACYRRGCEPACGAPRCADSQLCVPGCYCPSGTLRRGDDCVLPHDCMDCICTGAGAPAKHQTFEGDDLPFFGNCTYLASRDRNETGQHLYEIYATNGPCEGKTNSICTKAVHIIYDKNVIHITKDNATKKLQTAIGDSVVYKYPLKKDWVVISLQNKQDVHVILPDIHAEITIDQSKMAYTIRLPSSEYGNKTEGLCGVCAGVETHLITSNGTVTEDVDEYGKSWQATPATLQSLNIPDLQQCVPPPEDEPCTVPENNPCTALLNADRFGQCHALVDPLPFIESCREDLCHNVTDICSTLERYAAECRRMRVCLSWRDDLCPVKCEKPFVYRPCMDCELTCENHEEYTKKTKKACDKELVEGCYCPQGKVRVNNTCIEPSKCFPCDANNEHYAGDEWQEDACTTCTCSKSPSETSAHVSCRTETCSTPLCDEQQDLITSPPKLGKCCPTYLCVPKPTENIVCDEPKTMECGFGQVLKLKTKSNGCKEFACECKPASECEPIPSESEVEIFEPGMERVIDYSGCCARAQLLCRRELCASETACPDLYLAVVKNETGKCCPVHSCELPKDKCLVTLEWEAVPTGGERARTKPQTVLKDLDSIWQDGPCRSCRCTSPSPLSSSSSPSPSPPSPQCSVAQCAAPSSDQFELQPAPAPYQCCAGAKQVACKANGDIYKPGENWTSSENPCESYQCLQVEDGKLEKVVTLLTCDTTCQPGWKYFPSESPSVCCGKCKPVACIVDGKEHKIGDKWTSEDYCANYTCVDVNGTLQVQTSNETCPSIPEAVRKQFVLEEKVVPGKCCRSNEPVACRVGNKIYQEGQSWPSPDPCRNTSCSRDAAGRLQLTEHVEACSEDCDRGWAYRPAPRGRCCGRCLPDMCVVGSELRPPGSTWYSADNCTTFSCTKSGTELLVTSSQQQCSDVSTCPPQYLNPAPGGCCQVCTEPPAALKTCVPERIVPSMGAVRVALLSHGLCVNRHEIPEFKECSGHCASHTLYNNQTGSHESKCECCTATKYSPLIVQLECEDGSTHPHRVATPTACACVPCGGGFVEGVKGGYSGIKTPSGTQTVRVTRDEHEIDYDVPEIFQRLGH